MSKKMKCPKKVMFDEAKLQVMTNSTNLRELKSKFYLASSQSQTNEQPLDDADKLVFDYNEFFTN
jgi:hypothetical protein